MTSARKSWVFVPIVVFGIFWLAWSIYETRFYKAAIPEQIGVTGFVDSGSEPGLIVGLLSLSREGCGAAVYSLSDQTVKAIKMEGLDFFKTATQGRGYLQKRRDDYYYAYEPWKETPTGESRGETFVGLALSCHGGYSRRYTRLITESLMKPGSYYAQKPEGQLVVIPSLKIVILAYYG
jgi:hypothetical protein